MSAVEAGAGAFVGAGADAFVEAGADAFVEAGADAFVEAGADAFVGAGRLWPGRRDGPGSERKKPACRSSLSDPRTASATCSMSPSVCAVERKKLRHSHTCTPRNIRWW
ncbi:hypothetical protein SMICM17S_04491 [Streptomyces microflavus]